MADNRHNTDRLATKRGRHNTAQDQILVEQEPDTDMVVGHVPTDILQVSGENAAALRAILDAVTARLQAGHRATDMVDEITGSTTEPPNPNNFDFGELFKTAEDLKNTLCEILLSFSATDLKKDLNFTDYQALKQIRQKLSKWARAIKLYQTRVDNPDSTKHNLLNVQIAFQSSIDSELADRITMAFRKLAVNSESLLREADTAEVLHSMQDIHSALDDQGCKSLIWAKAFRTVLRSFDRKKFIDIEKQLAGADGAQEAQSENFSRRAPSGRSGYSTDRRPNRYRGRRSSNFGGRQWHNSNRYSDKEYSPDRFSRDSRSSRRSDFSTNSGRSNSRFRPIH
jgi:hypothetical protein